MATLSLSGIKYRAKAASGTIVIGGFPSYELVDASDAYALIIPGIPTISVTSVAVSTAYGISPVPGIAPNATIASVIASAIGPSILTGTPDAPAASATASVTTPVIRIEITTQAIATASVSAQTLSISISSISTANASSVSQTPVIEVTAVATANASVDTPVINISITSVATSTASSVTGIPSISLTSVAVSTASVTTPTISNTSG